MKKYFILAIVCISFLSTSCSKAQDGAFEKENIAKEQNDAPKITAEDQAIKDKYKELINELDLNDREVSNPRFRRFLSETEHIKNKYEREKIQMNIYLYLEMHQEAYDLNEKQLAENPSLVKQIIKCQLLELLNRKQDAIRSCNQKLAQYIKKNLNEAPKDDPQYPYGEWGYLLAMYKAGHVEYKQKMEAFIASTSDERMKSEFQSSYDVATEQK
ncbi:hypothetical protein [Acinetobacter pullicarnis]|uniref:hypothetical protein n=1 Tax=Acinetobacter pullicarnis TaxID=2576829 RepID=UPI001E4FE2FE|nr:hypothetical protein [Acinetobacter pullicarnis]